MDSQAPKEKVEDRCIYFVEVEVMYSTGTKKKSWHKRVVSVVSRFITPREIMNNSLTKRRIEEAVYDKKAKNKDVRVIKVHNYKCVGHTLIR